LSYSDTIDCVTVKQHVHPLKLLDLTIRASSSLSVDQNFFLQIIDFKQRKTKLKTI